MAEETAQTKLREAYDKARESLEKKRTELDKAFDKESEARVDVIRDLDKEKEQAESEVADLESKRKATEQLISRYQNEVLSWNQVNTAYKKIWGETVPGYPKFKSGDSEKEREEIRELRKQKLRRNSILVSLENQFEGTNNEVDELGTKVEDLETKLVPLRKEASQASGSRSPEREELRERIRSWDENASDEDALEWMWQNGFKDELKAVTEVETTKEWVDGRQVEVEKSVEGRLPLLRKIEELERRDEDAVRAEARQPSPGELDVEPLSAGTELSESERIREGLDSRGGAQGPPGDPLGEKLEEADRIEAEELQESFIDRVTDESQTVPEFGAPVSGGGGGDPEPEGLDEDTRQYIIDNFSMAGFLLQLPEGQLTAEVEVPPGSGNMVTVDNVMAYIDQYGITDTNQIEDMFLQTKWYNETEPQRREWQAIWYGEGGKVNQTWADSNANQRALLDDEMDQIRREAERLGLDLDDEALWNLAFEAKSMGFDTYEIREQFVRTVEEGGKYLQELYDSDEGRFEVTRNDIRDDAAQYMTTWTDADLDNAARRVYLGETTVEEIEAGIRAQAKADNPALASLIDQGYTPKMYFASYAKEAENLLERKVDFLGGDKGLYDQLVGTDWSSDGLARPMTRAEFGRTLRATPEWQYTDNARDAAYDAASQIARMFGAIG